MQTLQPNKTALQQGRYQIIKVLGQGSFGITYLATTRVSMQAAISGSLGRLVQNQEVEVKVCIKEFFMKDINSRAQDGTSVEGTSNTLYANYRRRFRKEAKNLSRLDHPNIVKVLEVFDENQTTYYVMQYIEGDTLDDYIRHHHQGHLAEEEAKGMITIIAQALRYMHERMMVHLDLKPKNIMIGRDGTPYIIDFGLSKQYDENGVPESSTTIGLGTPGYAPTEQADPVPNGTFPGTLDIYALGATLYKMLVGKTPPTANEVLNNGLPVRPSYVSVSLWYVVEKAMEPRRKDRTQSVGEFLARLTASRTEETRTDGRHDEETVVVDPDSDSDVKPKPRIKPEPEPKPAPKSHPRWPYVAAVAGFLACMLLWKMCAGPSAGDDVIAASNSTATLPAAIQQMERDMVFVEGGTFTMGATAEQGSDAYDADKPAHEVMLSSFCICKHEVTQAEWEAVMGINPSEFKGVNRPVEQVSWDDCQEFIRKLNAMTGKSYRLPTEAEWEYAARGGQKSQGYKYSGSNTIESVAWYTDNSGDETHAVMTKQANELGLYDMSGNVWEWCSDWYGDYSSSIQTNPKGPSSGSYRVLRGGSCGLIARHSCVSFRDGNTPDLRGISLGLRLAL